LRKASGFRIAGTARHDWERYDCPHSIEAVVDAMFGEADSKVNERAAPTPGRPGWWIAHGRVFGRLFMIGGYKNAKGEWTGVKIVSPVWPPR